MLLASALNCQPKFLLPAEATSALGDEREATVNQAVKQLAITTLIISHRQSTVEMAGTRLGLGN